MRTDVRYAGQGFVVDLIKESPKLEVLMQGETLVSVSPSESLFGYTYHSYMIPPFNPQSTLILGYGNGQVADLINRVHGQAKITGVDLVPQEYKRIEYKMEIKDAYEYVKSCTNLPIKTRFDYIAIDLFDGERVPDFVFDTEFVVRLKEMSKKLICVNALAEDFNRMKPYHEYGFKFHRAVNIFGNIVTWWGI